MPVVVKYDPNITQVQSSIIQDATEHNDGVMTAAMVRKLNGITAGGTLASSYAAATSPADNTLVLTHTQGGLLLDETGLFDADTIFSAGPLLVVKNPNGPYFPGAPGGVDGMFQDFVQISGLLVGVVDASTNYTSTITLSPNNDFHIVLGDSTELEGGDLYLRGGGGSDAAGPAPRHFGGSFRAYSGPQGPNQVDPPGSGNNVCGLVILDTAYMTLDTPGTGYPSPGIVTSPGGAVYYDANLGNVYANSVLIGRTDQDGVNPNTKIAGKNMSVFAAQNGGLLIETEVDGYGMRVAAGSGDITIAGAVTITLTAFGGEAQLQVSHFAGIVMTYGTSTFSLQPTTAKANVPLGAPALTTAARNALTGGLVAGDIGVQIYNTDEGKPNWYDGAGGWVLADGTPA